MNIPFFSALTGKASELDGKAWLNVTRPLTLDDLKGKIVIIDFWTYGCINCIHVIPELKRIEKKYLGKPVVVIGCHSAKFDNEQNPDNIRTAVLRYGITHPVVVDDDMKIWNSYGINAWPSFVVLAPDGSIFNRHSGEDVYDDFVDDIETLLTTYKGKLDNSPLPLKVEKAPMSILSFPGKLAYNPNTKQIAISDSNHNRVLISDLQGRVNTVIGSTKQALTDGSFDQAAFHLPQGVCFDPENDNFLYVAEQENHTIRKIDLNKQTVTTIAGNGTQGSYFPDSATASKAMLSTPWDVAIHDGWLYVAMAGNHQLWRINLKTGTLERFAGSGHENATDATGLNAAFAQPSGLAILDDTLYVADSEVSSVRAVNLKTREVETVAGSGQLFRFGDIDGAGPNSLLQHCLGVAIHDGKVFIADTYNHKIRAFDPKTNRLESIYGGNGELYEPAGLVSFGDTTDGGGLLVADTGHHRLVLLQKSTSKTKNGEWKASEFPLTIQTPSTTPKEWGKTVPIAFEFAEGLHATPGAMFVVESGSKRASFTPTKVVVPAKGDSKITVYYCSDNGVCLFKTIPVKDGSPKTISLS